MQGSAADLWWISLILVLVISSALLLCAVRFRGFFKIGIRSTRRRLPQAVSLCIGGIIGTGVICGALIAGDSLDKMVEEQSVKALGEIDVVITSERFFESSVLAEVAAADGVQANTDHIAPLIVSSGTARHSSTGALEGGVNVYGVDTAFYDLGAFSKDGGEAIPNLQEDQCVVNSFLGDHLDVAPGEQIVLTVKDPNPLDAFFLTSGTGDHTTTLTVVEVYENTGLGSMNLASRNTNVNNLFLRLDAMQELLGEDGMLNTIVISNKGDEMKGTEKDGRVVRAVEEKLDELYGYEEVGFSVLELDDQVVVKHSDVLFKDDWARDFIEEEGLHSSGLITYFVNSLSTPSASVAYSTVAGIDLESDREFGEFYSGGTVLDADTLGRGEIIINNWTAEYLGIGPGDTIKMDYSVLDDNYAKVDHSIDLTVAAVVDITGKAAEEWLLPDFPGISDIDTCTRWDPPFEIDLDSIEEVDQEYWDRYRGVPKAYINLELAQELWGTFQGNLTHLKILTDDPGSVSAGLDDSLGAGDYGISVETAKADQLATKEGMWIFTGMFLFFGAMIVAAGALLIINMFSGMGLERKREIGILKSQGASNLEVGVAFFTEGAVYSFISALAGTIAGVGIGWGLIIALNTVWARSVESNDVPFYFQWQTLVNTFGLGLFICTASVLVSVVLVSRMNVVDAINEKEASVVRKGPGRSKGRFLANAVLLVGLVLTLYSVFGLFGGEDVAVQLLIGPALIIIGQGMFSSFRVSGKRRLMMNISAVVLILYIIGYSFFFNQGDSITLMTLFGLEGLVLVSAGFILFVNNFAQLSRVLAGLGKMGRISASGAGRRTMRLHLSVLSVALVVFIIVALSVVGSFQARALDEDIDRQTGGWDIRAVSTIPYTGDISEEDHEFLDDTTVLQIKSRGEPGGTCSNLNVLFPPQILGVPPEFTDETKVTFSSSLGDKKDRDVWGSLDEERSDGAVPIVVDMNTLVWIYNRNLGDVFVVEGDLGTEYELKVVGVMDASIYAGMFVMSQENIEKIYPLSAKYTFFLFRTTGDVKQRSRDIEIALGDHGMDAVPAAELAKENVDFESSYMTIFQGYLVLGVLIGATGIAVIVYRSAAERKWEIGVLKSLGLSNRDVGLAFILEATIISVPGIILGTLAGLVSALITFTIWGGAGFTFPWVSVFVIPAGIYLVSVVFSLIPAYKASRMRPVEALKRRW